MILVIDRTGTYNDEFGRAEHREKGELHHTNAPYGNLLIKEGFAHLRGERAGVVLAEGEDDLPATRAAVSLAEEAGIDLFTVEGTGQHGRVIKDDVLRAIGAAEGM